MIGNQEKIKIQNRKLNGQCVGAAVDKDIEPEREAF